MTSYKIISCSSEDSVHLSSNLKNPDLYRAWQTDGYVKKASVDIAFPKPTKITLVDIGNAGSAFVEILVGKEGATDEQLQVLVPINSQMGVHDSKNGTNRTKTKCFEKFTADVGTKEWDRMRVVCTQPFTSNFPFGLSYLFVNQRNSQPSSSASSPATPSISTSIKSEKNKTSADNNEDADTDVDEESIEASKRTQDSIKRENSALIKKLKKEKETKDKVKAEAEEENNSDPSNNHKHNNKNNTKNIKQERKQESDEETSKSQKPNTPKDAKQKGKAGTTPKGKDTPTNTILKGVVFAISGIQNPERADIREKGTALGAVYKQNWEDGCTHLICKFANTPKYNEVKAKGGIIATPQWISDCAAKSKKLNLTKKYSLEEDKPSLSADSTAEKKKKKKKKNKVHDPTKGYDSDPDDDSDGGPNEYDYNDSFIDRHFVDPNAGDDDDFLPSDEMGESSEEDISELQRDTNVFFKKNGKPQKRPRKIMIDPEEDQSEEPTKHHKSNDHLPSSKHSSKPHPSHDSGKGKTFTKQQHKSEHAEKANKPQSEKPKHHGNKISNNMSDEEGDDEEKLTKHKAHKPKSNAIRQAEGSASEGTEEMADEEVKAQFKHLMPGEDEEVPQKTKENALKQKKQQLPNDEFGTEEMEDEDFPRGKPGKYHSDNSDSDGTQPLEKDELMNVIGALEGQGKGEGTLVMPETNWEDFVSQKMTAKTQEKAALGKNHPIEQLPDFLTPVKSFFSGVRSKNEHMLRRYIIAYNGKIDDYLGDDTKYIFTEKAWDRNFDDALKMNPDLVFVKPDWVFACHAKQAMVDLDRYVITNKK